MNGRVARKSSQTVSLSVRLDGADSREHPGFRCARESMVNPDESPPAFTELQDAHVTAAVAVRTGE